MKPRSQIHRSWALFACTAALLLQSSSPDRSAHAAEGATLFWHHKREGLVALWQYRPRSVERAHHSIVGQVPATEWELIGSADFNRDGESDALWRQVAPPATQFAVWYLRDRTRIDTRVLELKQLAPPWIVQTVGDLDNDGHPDLVWRNFETGENRVWYLRLGHLLRQQELEPFGGSSETLDWRVVGIADLGGPSTPPDGHPDLIWCQRTNAASLSAVWFMNLPDRTNRLRSTMLPPRPSPEWQFGGIFHFNRDRRPDFLWRHAALGLNAAWFMDGIRQESGVFLETVPESDWRLAGQDYAESTWMVGADLPRFAAEATGTNQLTLQFQLPFIGGPEVHLERREYPGGSWSTLATKTELQTWRDTVKPGVVYEYRWFRGPPQHRYPRWTLRAGIDLPPIRQRGHVLLLIDETLADGLADLLPQLRQDLIGDGWRLTESLAPRHDDRHWPSNPARIARVKTLVRDTFAEGESGTNVIFILGHVAIPYSGFAPTDGHADHQGAWPADAYYGDVGNYWTDTRSNLCSTVFSEIRNIPGDGKFDQDYLQEPLRAAVGRVDFARLPALRAGEVELLRRYLQKDHRFRHRQLPGQADWDWGVPAQVVAFNHFSGSLFSRRDIALSNASRHDSAWFGFAPSHLLAADAFIRNDVPAALACLSAPGEIDRVNGGIASVEHTAARLSERSRHPRAFFHLIRASYMGDWNLRSNNFLRALLASETYGLAAVWKNIGYWRFDGMALGEHLGAGMVRMMNRENEYYRVGDTHRDLTILGDPTLRFPVVAAPSGVTASRASQNVHLTWKPSQPDLLYHIDWAPDLRGPFHHAVTDAPIAGTNYTHTNAPQHAIAYLVRAVRPFKSGSGSGLQISQGAFSPVVDP